MKRKLISFIVSLNLLLQGSGPIYLTYGLSPESLAKGEALAKDGALRPRATGNGNLGFFAPPLTSELIRGLHPKETQNGLRETGRLLFGLYTSLLKERVEIANLNLSRDVARDSSVTFPLGRLNITCFEAVLTGWERGYLFAITTGAETIGHGLLGYSPSKKSIDFRYSIHGERVLLPELNHVGKGYGWEALVLIMAICVNSPIFGDVPVERLRWQTSITDETDRIRRVQSFLMRVGFNDQLEFVLQPVKNGSREITGLGVDSSVLSAIDAAA